MKSKIKNYRLAILIIMALTMMVLLLAGCGIKEAIGIGGAIRDIRISTAVDQNGRAINPASVFPSDVKKFYCSFKLSGFPADSKIKAEWIFYPGATMPAPSSDNTTAMVQPLSFIIQTHTGTITGDGYTYVSMEVPTSAGITSENVTSATWLAGTYKVDLYVGDKEKGSTTFEVKDTTGAPTN